MGKKRKRPARACGPTAASQTSITTSPRRFKLPTGPATRNDQTITHPLISLYYREVLTLRNYLLRQLPASSKLRRRRIASLQSSSVERSQDSTLLAHLLDSTLVGVQKESSPKVTSERQRDYRAFTQSQSRSILVSTDTGPTSPQSEIVNFVIETLFRLSGGYGGPQHLLAHGYAYGNDLRATEQAGLESSILGLVAQFPSNNVRTLKESPWADVLALLGQSGEEIMMRLLFDCGIFAPINAQRGNFYQLSGFPLSKLEQLDSNSAKQPTAQKLPEGNPQSYNQNHLEANKPNSIIFSRRRMLYSQPTSTAKNRSASGLGGTHVLNRFSSLDITGETVHVMSYIFPRQFGLRNVFVSTGNRRDNEAQLNSHINREDEISQLKQKQLLRHTTRELTRPVSDKGELAHLKIPKRLRGRAMELVQRLRVRHARCSYWELLKHYCPAELVGPPRFRSTSFPIQKNKEAGKFASSIEETLVTQASAKSSIPEVSTKAITSDTLGETEMARKPTIKKPKVSLTEYATPASSVSAFCRAVLKKIIPPHFFGDGLAGTYNCNIVMKHVDAFIKMRRFESPSLHLVCKGLKVTEISWLVPPKKQDTVSGTDRISLSDFQKRTELFHEFIYYIFDSILIPLIRVNFYVTESQTHRCRLFYFRQDVWKRLIEQPIKDLKETTFKPFSPEEAKKKLAGRSLGLGSLRLLPKSAGLRPILNLKKQLHVQRTKFGKKKSYLGASVNSSLLPIYGMLSYERERCPANLGSSIMSMGEMHPKLKSFKDSLIRQGSASQMGPSGLPQLYFVKLDIQACFDTIPQAKLLSLIEKVISEEAYHFVKSVGINPPLHGRKPQHKWMSRAAPLNKQQHLRDIAAVGAMGRKANMVYIDTIKQTAPKKTELLGLLKEHVEQNLVMIGKEYFQQRNGIPQGSVLSNLLCNFFYAELERETLHFLQPADSLLLRLVDDFLLITTDVAQATQFLQIMLRGQPAYGVSVNPAKSMVNFTAAVDGCHIPRLEGTLLFPYCGSLIDTRTLEIHRDQDRMLEGGDSAAVTLSNTLTVETSRAPGHSFHRKMLALMRPQMQSMYLDTNHNSRQVVLGNLYTGFIAVGMKMYRYMKSLRGRSHPQAPIIIQTIHDLIQQTIGTIRARRASDSTPLSCAVQLSHLQYLGAAAFRFVLKRKQTRYARVLQWLDSLVKGSRPATNAEAVRLQQVVRRGTTLFDAWRF
ncbi:hypothetical protein N7462_006177 [Penicillium macrosclerotiorum]|uniref:uncharacterized protein n=1 Tax=Penicillium macrosclerotiorum TaxID=303699 RepID=UPI002546D305|nr:uncharacterized protein N7462_006177 [Penicillium macrosclerotiorum]KAJ5683012.1 hypothetical protein N7462_006177 [Penicillium macrosclerotiorum]